MRLLITGADGFVGRWLVRDATARGHAVVASVMPGSEVPAEWLDGGAVGVVRADMRDAADVTALAGIEADAIVHLAAVASGTAARLDPETANLVNGAMTVQFADALSKRERPPRFLFISTAEVYGPGHDSAIPETTPINPKSPYAVSKAGAEFPLRLFWEERSFPVVIARAFPHTGPGQSTAYVLPALASRLQAARRAGEHVIAAGNLAAIRDFLDVRDVVRAYLLLLEQGESGAVYNVASGTGRRLSDCFAQLDRLVGAGARVEQDASLLRTDDIAVLIGDATKLRVTTGWTPQIPFERTLQDLVDAQAD